MFVLSLNADSQTSELLTSMRTRAALLTDPLYKYNLSAPLVHVISVFGSSVLCPSHIIGLTVVTCQNRQQVALLPLYVTTRWLTENIS